MRYSPPWWMSAKVLMALAFIAFGVLAAVVVAYWKYSADVGLAGKIDFSAKIAFGAAAVLSLVIGYQTLRLNIHQLQIRAAFEILGRFDKAEERTARATIEELLKRTGRLQEYLNDSIPSERIKGALACMSPNERLAAESVLSFFEDVALAIKSGYASEPIIFRSIHPKAVFFVNGLRAYIHIVREEEQDSTYNEDALDMINRWKMKQSIFTSDSELIRPVQ